MKILPVALIVFVTMLTNLTTAQPVIGFWGFTSVMVGERNMTPVAKWAKYSPDGTFISGNGWTQNSIGTWVYNEETNEFTPSNTNGIKDEYGPFRVSFEGEKMIWARDEDGMKVTVSLIKITDLPASPSDSIKGLWILSRVIDKNGKRLNDFDPNQKQFIHIRPDMRYRLRNPDQTFSQGFWHMDGHRPIFSLLNYDRQTENEVFSVSFNEQLLVMKSQNEEGLVYQYMRTNEFPK